MTKFLESKSIESQMEDNERERFARENTTIPALSFVEIERRESLRLSMSRIREQLMRTTNPKRKRTLRRALKELEAEI